MATIRRKASTMDDFDPAEFGREMGLTGVYGDETVVRFHFDHIGDGASARFSEFAVDLTLDDIARCIKQFAEMKIKASPLPTSVPASRSR